MPAPPASKLWKNGSLIDWQQTHQGYADAINIHGSERLVEKDSWYIGELPGAIQARQPPHMTQGELVKLVEWKLSRGTFRPKLVDYAKQADPKNVVDATTAAFKTLTTPGSTASSRKASKGSRGSKSSSGSQEEQEAGASPSSSVVAAALDQLTKPLKGVGPATASAMLAAVESSCPFMSDEALAAATGVKPDYSVKAYMRVLEELRNKAHDLSEQEAASGSNKQWTAVDVEQCLFVEALRHKPKPKTSQKGAAAGSKRKRTS